MGIFRSAEWACGRPMTFHGTIRISYSTYGDIIGMFYDCKCGEKAVTSVGDVPMCKWCRRKAERDE